MKDLSKEDFTSLSGLVWIETGGGSSEDTAAKEFHQPFGAGMD